MTTFDRHNLTATFDHFRNSYDHFDRLAGKIGRNFLCALCARHIRSRATPRCHVRVRFYPIRIPFRPTLTPAIAPFIHNLCPSQLAQVMTACKVTPRPMHLTHTHTHTHRHRRRRNSSSQRPSRRSLQHRRQPHPPYQQRCSTTTSTRIRAAACTAFGSSWSIATAPRRKALRALSRSVTRMRG